MDDIRVKIREWSVAIRLAKFDGLTEDIETAQIVCPSLEVNNALYKLVLYLCQSIQQCDKTKTSTGIDIFHITYAICSKLTSIPDVGNFFAGVYHIIGYLIELKMYKEAMKLGDFFLPGTVFHAASTDCVNKYAALSNLWHKTTNKFFNPSEVYDEKKFEMILMLINHELRMQVYSLKDGSKYLLNKIIFYNDKIKSLSKRRFEEKFRNAMIQFIAQTKISLGNESKSQTYKACLRFLNDIILDKINADNIESVNDRVKQFFVIFKTCMGEDEECYDCFVVYEQLCRMLVRRLDEFTTENFRAMHTYMKNVDTIVVKYGNDNAVRCNSYSILSIVNALQLFWFENKGTKKYMLEKFITNIAALIKHQSRIFSNIRLTECSCGEVNCRITVDIYNSIALMSKVLVIIMRNIDDLSPNISSTTIDIAEECVQYVCELQRANCGRWCKLWPSIGSSIHNITVRKEKMQYKETVRLYTLLATTTVKLNAFDNGSSFVSSDNPLCVALHRLSSTHYAHGKYDEAMITCALNAYVGYKYKTCKAFRLWTSIKYKYPSSHGCTIVNCLKSKKNTAPEIGIDINLEDCDLATICIREIRSLREAEIDLSSSIMSVLDLMRAMDVSPIMYATCVIQLGYHLLSFNVNPPISAYVNEALFRLKDGCKQTYVMILLKGHLKFYELIENLNEINDITAAEMKDTKVKLYATRDTNANGNPANNIVPGYSLINVITAKNIALKFGKILKMWRNCNEKMDMKTVDCLESDVMIRTAIVAAEYIRFFQYYNLEKEAWEIAYELAKKFDDKSAIVYITARCISGQHVNNEWIRQAESYIDTLRMSTDPMIIETVAMFKLSLSEFYFKLGLTTEADELFNDVISLPDISFGKNLSTYLSSIDILLSHKFNFDYIENLVRGLYTMLTIDDYEVVKRQRREQRLYELDVLFKFTNHIALRMNSLLSYREISAHLVRRLSLAQKLGVPLHVAECLKNLCFIDLSRNELEDCEVKLQGLEHILMMETIEISMQGNLSPAPSVSQVNTPPTQIMEPVRDVFQNDSSPVLRMNVFKLPNFMSHDTKCECFNCSNVTYQYLVFSCTHIRAQLYALQNHINHALQHFEGAFNIIRKILNLSDVNVGFHSYHEIVEYVLFMLDFARFLKHHVPSSFEGGLNIALHAVEVCEKYKTINSPVYLTARELIFEYRFQNIYENIDYSKFAMPNTDGIDVSEYFNLDEENETIYSTPVRTVVEKSVHSVRRKKTPPLLTLSKVSVDTVEDDTITMSSVRPSNNTYKLVKKKTTKVRPIRRALSEDEYDLNGNENGSDCQQSSEEKVVKKGTASRMNDNTIDEQTIQKPRNTRSASKSKKPILVSSDESSEDSENIDRVCNMLGNMCVSATISVKSKDETVESKNGPVYNNTISRKPSTGRKKKVEHVSSIDSRSEFEDNSSCGSSNGFSTSGNSNIDSDDEVVECSIEEPRRSRRLASRTKRS